MRLTDRLSQPQKIVIVLALGMAFGAAEDLPRRPWEHIRGGWYAYAPLSQTPFTGTGLFTATRPHGWLRLLIWLALIGLWALLSVRVCDLHRNKPRTTTPFRSSARANAGRRSRLTPRSANPARTPVRATRHTPVAAHSETSLRQVVRADFLMAGNMVFFPWRGRGRRVGAGPGVAWPKSRCSGCEPGRDQLPGQRFLGCADRHRGMRALVRVHADYLTQGRDARTAVRPYEP